MKKHHLCAILFGAFLLAASSAHPADRQMEFLEGLREREYYDYALLYLDQIEADPNIAPEIRDAVPFERAMTLLQSARTIPSSELQNKQLDQALALFDQFAKAHPNHPKSGQANSARAQILLGKARMEIWQSRSPANQQRRSEFQRKARELTSQARTICQTAYKQHQKTRDSFPKFIDENTQKSLFEQRRRAEVALIRAELDAALCLYDEAQTYDRGSSKAKGLLTQAANAFEALHTKYRSQAGGLFARMWQGKCFEEQGDVQKALGVYTELLSQPATTQTMKNLHNQVQQFRLICLNDDSQKKFDTAIQEAQEWLTKNRGPKSRSPVALGISWEQANAQEKLAGQTGQAKADKERLLRAALANVRLVSQLPGEYKDSALSKMRSLMIQLHGPNAAQDPKDFETAYGLAREIVKKIQQAGEALDKAKKAHKPPAEIAKLKQDRQLHLDEAARLLSLALTLTIPKTPQEDINNARYVLAYVHYLLGNSYKAAILGEFVASHYYDGDTSAQALDCAYLALAAFRQAHDNSPEKERTADRQNMVRVAELIATHWPDNDRANDARVQVGQVYRDLNQPVEAAKWYDQIPANSSRYAEAQGAAGQTYWMAYLNALTLPEKERPPAKELNRWQTAAEEHLRKGVEKTETSLSTTGKTPPELVSAKVSLVQIVLSQGRYQQAIDVLNRSPHSVIQAIAVPQGAARPPAPNIRSTEFASLVYQLQLRAYVGLQKLDDARQTMDNLEQTASKSGGGEAVTAIYVELGKQLQEELERLKKLGDRTRFSEVRTSFENFLNDLSQRPGQTLSSLIWIAETYYGLGEATDEDELEAAVYFDNAGASYEKILDRAKNDPKFIEQGTLFAIKLRLLNCKRRQHGFQEALDVAADLLAQKPKSLEAQMETAYILQEWGMSGEGDSWKKLRDAIVGGQIGKTKTVFWGWGQIALNLQRLLATANPENKTKYQPQLYESQYNAAYCRRQYGLAQSDKAKSKAELEKAKYGILAFVSVSGEIDEEWWNKLDQLYRQIQTDLGEKVVALEKPTEPLAAPIAVAREQSPKEIRPPKAKKRATSEAEASGSGWGLILCAIILFGFGGLGIFWTVKSRKRPRRVAYGMKTPVVLPDDFPGSRSGASQRTRRQPSKRNPAGRPGGKSTDPSKRPKRPKREEP